jgi:hypothetical protein
MRLLILFTAALLLAGCRKTVREADAPTHARPYTSGATFSI